MWQKVEPFSQPISASDYCGNKEQQRKVTLYVTKIPANPDTVPPTLYVTIVLQVTFTFVTSAELTVPDPLVTVQV